MSAEGRIQRLESQLNPDGFLLRMTFGFICPGCGESVYRDGKRIYNNTDTPGGGFRVRVRLSSDPLPAEHQCSAAQLVAAKAKP